MRLILPKYDIITKIGGLDMLRRIEVAGRTCYKSEGQMTEDSTNRFIASIIRRGHESVIEHESISVRFVVDRGVTHEMVRHRLCSFSQESTRYCRYDGGVTFIIPPWVDIEPGVYDGRSYGYERGSHLWFCSMLDAERCYLELLEHAWTPQQARAVLPNSLKTEIVWTANLREWRHILKLRTSKAAHPQMREIMTPLLNELKEAIPIMFDDINGFLWNE